MLCKRGLCRHAVFVCLCVCPSVTFVNSVKTNKRIFNFFTIFYHRVANPFYFFPVPNGMTIFRRESPPLTGPSNAGGVGRNRYSEPISGFTAVPQVVTLIAGSKRRSLLMTGDDDEMFMKRSLNATPKTTEQKLCFVND